MALENDLNGKGQVTIDAFHIELKAFHTNIIYTFGSIYKDNEVNSHEPYDRTTTHFIIHLCETKEFYQCIV